MTQKEKAFTYTSDNDSNNDTVVIPIDVKSNYNDFPILYIPPEEAPQNPAADGICASTLKKVFPLEVWVEICTYLKEVDIKRLREVSSTFGIMYKLFDVAKQSLINEKNELTAKRLSLVKEIAEEKNRLTKRMAFNNSVRNRINSPCIYIVLAISLCIDVLFAAFFSIPEVTPKRGSPMTRDEISLLYRINSYALFCNSLMQMIIVWIACGAELRNARANRNFSIWLTQKEQELARILWQIDQVDRRLAQIETSSAKQRNEKKNYVTNINGKNEKEKTETSSRSSSDCAQKRTF